MQTYAFYKLYVIRIFMNGIELNMRGWQNKSSYILPNTWLTALQHEI